MSHKEKSFVPSPTTTVERVTEWLRCWTRDQGVWDSITAAMVLRKSIRQALNLHPLAIQW